MSAIHVVVPGGIDDPARPSGGNTYDRRVCRELAAAGWTLAVHPVDGAWPHPDRAARRALSAVIRGIPDGAPVLLDGLVASTAPDVLVPEARRLRLVALVHMPLGLDGADAGVRRREADVMEAAACVITTSGWARRELLRLYRLRADRVRVAAPGVDRAQRAPGTATGGALVCVAAVVPGKGHDLLVEALAPLAALEWHCRCVGSLDRDRSFADGLRRTVARRGLTGRIELAGPRAGDDLERVYRAADLLVLPSRGETYGMVITEALAHGVPVLAAAVGGVPEAVGRDADGTCAALLVPPGDALSVGRALRSWLTDGELRERLRSAADRRRASLTGWAETASVISDALTWSMA